MDENKSTETASSMNDAVAKKIQAIQEEIERKNREAEKLLSYLVEQQSLAKQEEELEEEDLKRQGIIVGQHIPSLPSKLNLDPSELSEFETFSSTLLVAKDLIQQNRINFLRRTGNLPISEAAEALREANKKTLSQLDPEKPHYLIQTKSAKEREERNTVRFGDTIQEVRKATEKQKTIKEAATGAKKPSAKENKAVLTTKERIENENVIKALQHKMNYLRNPRNNPNSVTKMLVKPKDFFSKPAVSAVEGDDEATGFGSAISGEEREAESSVSSKIKNKYAKYLKLDNNPLFVAEPSHIYFMDYEIGTKYTKTISFKNVSAVSRSVRILPPKSKLFTLSPLKYPPNCSNGIIAPGMSVSCVLTFLPENLGDYEEYIQVHTEAGSTQVQIIAQREPPNLDLPEEINLGYVLVGDAQRSVFSCSNVGGYGNFTIVEDDDPENCENNDLNAYSKDCLRIPPFTIYPSHFGLQKNQSIDLVFEIVPLTRGFLQRQYKIICDNGQIKTFTIMATSKEINVSTTDINHIDFNDKDTHIYRDLYFHGVVAGAELTQMISIVNDTRIPVEYEWVWIETNIGKEEWNRIGQDLIVKREMIDHPFKELQASMSEGDLPLLPPMNTEAAVVDEALLRSLKETLHHDSSSIIKGNHTKHGPFEILPARGVLAGEGAAEFKIIYNPKRQDQTSLRAVMMIKSIPIAAMPNHPDQAKALQKLLTEGHGRYPRLRSWLEEVGTNGKVLPYRKPTGHISEEKKLISLAMIITLLYSQLDEEESRMKEQELPRMNRWIRNILQHVFGIRRRDALTSPSGSMTAMNSSSALVSHASSVHTQQSKLDSQLLEIQQPKSEETIELFDWKPNQSPYPILLPELTLKYQEEKEEDDDDAKDIEDGSDDESIVEQVATDTITGTTLRDLSDPEMEMCHEIYMDTFQVIKLFGEYIATQLDQKVGHEAIDYLKECSYTHVPSITFLVHGQSQSQRLILSPPHLKIGGSITLGAEFTGQLTLVNPNEAAMQVVIDKEHAQIIRKSTSSLHDEIHEELEKLALPSHPRRSSNEIEFDNEGDRGMGGGGLSNPSISENSMDSLIDNLQLQVSTDRLLLLPHSQETITLTGKMFKLGHFEILLPIKSIADDTARTETIGMEVQIFGAKLRFNTAEVDIGLLGVGGENTYSLSIANEENVPLMYMMKPTIHVDNLIGSPKGETPGPAKKGSFFAETSRGSGGAGHESARSSKGGNEPESARSLRSARSQLSRASSMRSEDFSVADSQATPGGDFKIELKNAVITIDPPSGVIPPHSTTSVSIISKAGKIPQRVRGMIESRIFDLEGKHELAKQYLNLRGEVQSPKVLLYPQHHALGQVYVGRPVSFQFTLENICNLPTKFKFLRPAGPSSFFRFQLEPMKGSLEAKEKLIIRGSFTSLTTGLIDDILSCKMFGISTPLGIHLKALSKGISLEFINYRLGDPYPQPIAKQEDVQFPVANEKPPDPRPIEPILLGTEVPLYERRKATFIIRNLSAIPAPFEIMPKKFKVIEKKKRFGTRAGTASQAVLGPPGGVAPASVAVLSPALANMSEAPVKANEAQAIGGAGPTKGGSVSARSVQNSVHSISTASISTVQTASTAPSSVLPRQDLILAPHEDGTNKFNSEAGKKYIAFELNRREDRKYLKSGLGASYYIDIQSGILPPWSIQEVNLYAFNDIPGCYDDELEVMIRENEVIRKMYLPIKMTVVGCPIVIEKHTVGMTEKLLSQILPPPSPSKARTSGNNNDELQSDSSQGKSQLLQLGQVCEHGNVLKRHFIVKNYGSKPAKVKWTVRGLAAKANGPIKVTLKYQVPTENSSARRKKLDPELTVAPSSLVAGKVKTVIRFWDDIAKESPFQIEPYKVILPPYEKQIFTATLLHNSPARMEKAVLTANIVIEEEIKDVDGFLQPSVSSGGLGTTTSDVNLNVERTTLNPPASEVDNEEQQKSLPIQENQSVSMDKLPTKPGTSSLTSRGSSAKKQTFELSLYVEGKYIHPELIINDQHHQIPLDQTIAPDTEGIRLQAKSTLLFTAPSNPSITTGGGMTTTAPSATTSAMMTFNPICSKLVTIKNPLESEVTIHVATEGALLLKDYEAESVDPTDLFQNKNQKTKSKQLSGQSQKPRDGSISPDRSLSPERESVRAGGGHGKKVGFEEVESPPGGGGGAMTSARSASVSIRSQKNPQKEGKVLHLLPNQSTKFMIVFHPKRYLREQLMSTFGKEYGKPTEQKSYLLFTYPTGQSLKVPVITAISTPFISGSAPRLFFGTCHVQRTCQGIFLLSNPTDVPARWTITHIPGGGQWKQSTAIRVKGFERIPEVDDPTVFHISPTQGVVDGPTVSVAAAMAAPPKDYHRKEDAIVPERLVQSSWATNTLTLHDTLSNKFDRTMPAMDGTYTTKTPLGVSIKPTGKLSLPLAGTMTTTTTNSTTNNDIHYPMPITIMFRPNKNQKYCSRFRFTCEFANSFDLVLQGEGTYEEHEHQPLNPVPRG